MRTGQRDITKLTVNFRNFAKVLKKKMKKKTCVSKCSEFSARRNLKETGTTRKGNAKIVVKECEDFVVCCA